MPISNHEVDYMQSQAKLNSKRSKSTRNITNYDPLLTSGYHEYNGKVYEPVNEFPQQHGLNTYNTQGNFGNYNSHSMRNSYTAPVDYSTSYLGNEYSKSYKTKHRNNMYSNNL